MNEKPQQLSLNSDGDLVIDWSDQKQRLYRVAVLRDNCPCATCREKRKAESSGPSNMLPVLSMEETQALKIHRDETGRQLRLRHHVHRWTRQRHLYA